MMKWLGKDSVKRKEIPNQHQLSRIAICFKIPPLPLCKVARISIYYLIGETLWCTLKFIHHEKQNNTLPLYPG